MIAIGRYGGGNNIVDRVETVYPYARGYSILGLPKILCLPKILGLLLSFFNKTWQNTKYVSIRVHLRQAMFSDS